MLSHMPRVARPDEVTPLVEREVGRRALVAPERGSELALDQVELAPDASLELVDELHDTLFFAREGSGTVDDAPFVAPASVLVPAGAPAVVTAGPDALVGVRATVGAATDLHAPLGPLEAVVSLDDAELASATGARSFQVLHGPHNGSTRATAFVGFIPPGKAPWHYHLYDEIVVVLRGEGRLHVADSSEPLVPGAAFRLHPREVHIVENTDPADALVTLGVFTPAGSPSAAYLTADVAAAYAFAVAD